MNWTVKVNPKVIEQDPCDGTVRCLLMPRTRKPSPSAYGKLGGPRCGKVRNTLRSMQRHQKWEHR